MNTSALVFKGGFCAFVQNSHKLAQLKVEISTIKTVIICPVTEEISLSNKVNTGVSTHHKLCHANCDSSKFDSCINIPYILA